jgi:hypothetical protein
MQSIGRSRSTSRAHWIILAVLAIAAQAALAVFLRYGDEAGGMQPPPQLAPSADDCAERGACLATPGGRLKVA